MASARLSILYISTLYLLEHISGQPASLNNNQQIGFKSCNSFPHQQIQRNTGCNVCKANNQNTMSKPLNNYVEPAKQICGQPTTRPVSHLQLLKQMQQRQQQPNLFQQAQQPKFHPQLTQNFQPGLVFPQKPQSMNSIIDQSAKNQLPEAHFTIPCSCPSSSDPEFVPIPFKLIPEHFQLPQSLTNVPQDCLRNVQTNLNITPQPLFDQSHVSIEPSLHSSQNQGPYIIHEPHYLAQSSQNEKSTLPQQQNNEIPQYPLPFAYGTNDDVPITKRKSASLKALLPLIFELLQEKDSRRCQHCKCDCMNKPNLNYPQVFSGYSSQRNYGSENDLSVKKISQNDTANFPADMQNKNSTEITSDEENATDENFDDDDDENHSGEDE